RRSISSRIFRANTYIREEIWPLPVLHAEGVTMTPGISWRTLRELLVAGLVSLAAAAPNPVLAQEMPSPAAAAESSASELRKRRLLELMSTEVTPVPRHESTVGQSPAAVFVITGEMIRRSGATTFPELFRMVPGMDVARIDANKWTVSSRGVVGNQRFSDKL